MLFVPRLRKKHVSCSRLSLAAPMTRPAPPTIVSMVSMRRIRLFRGRSFRWSQVQRSLPSQHTPIDTPTTHAATAIALLVPAITIAASPEAARPVGVYIGGGAAGGEENEVQRRTTPVALSGACSRVEVKCARCSSFFATPTSR